MLTMNFCDDRTAVKRGAGLGFLNLLMIVDCVSDDSIRGTVISWDGGDEMTSSFFTIIIAFCWALGSSFLTASSVSWCKST